MPFREKINLAIYDSKESIGKRLRVLNFLVSLIAIGTLIYYHGFSHDSATKEGLMIIIKASFAFYIIRYFLKYLYSFNTRNYFKSTWFEGLLMLLLLAQGMGDIIWGVTVERAILSKLGVTLISSFHVLIVQLYLLIIITIDIGRTGDFIPRKKAHPSSLFLLSFLFIILFGALLLMLPEATVSQGSMTFTDALFTSTSAVTVTGLIVVDTATFFTVKGHFIIMMLIQLGALNTIAFGVFFALFTKLGIGMKQHVVTEDFFGGVSHSGAKSMLGKIILWSIVIETAGAGLMYACWNVDVPFQNQGDKILSSVFHSISAFNNAGFSLFTNGFYHEALRTNYLVHIPVILLMFLGTLGFVPLFEMFSFSKMKERWKYPWKKFEFSTKIAVYFSVGLIIFGALAFFVLERSNTLSHHTFSQSVITSIFQALTPRNIGFNTVDIKQCSIATITIFLLLMFIGAGSASSGGGIRTSSFAIMYATVIATIRGKKEVELFKRTIPNDLVFKAFTIFIFFLSGILIACILLSITESRILAMENRGFIDIVFDAVSAFTTTGLTMGITHDLSEAGKFIEIVCMYIGRVGTLSVAYIFGGRLVSTAYKYAEAHTLVG